MRTSDDQSMELQAGTIVTGRYEIVKRLGRGSMGFVYACRDREHAGRLVAMKVLFQDFAKDKTGAARFRNEILAAFEVHHENVMSAFEYIRDGGITAYTMEYVGGGDLAERISNGELLPLHEVLRLWSQMAAGVEAIHKKGIIHRDLKPENILLTTTGDVKIADFGIARTGHGPKLTEHGGVVGTIDYVSPEYMLRGQVDHRSDIYALGILAYEMLTGSSPFQGDSVYATMTKRLKQDPVAPSQVRAEQIADGKATETFSAGVDTIVLRAMAREPEARYQAAAEMQHDIDQLRAELGFLDIPSEMGTLAGVSEVPAQGFNSRVVRVDLGSADENPSTREREGSMRDSNPLERFFDDEPAPAPAAPQMEPLLNRRVSKRGGADWIRPGAGGGNTASLQRVANDSSGLRTSPVLNSGAMPSHKLRTLSGALANAAPKQRSWWQDVFLALIMLFVGVGFGFAVISVVLPNLLEGGAQEVSDDSTAVTPSSAGIKDGASIGR